MISNEDIQIYEGAIFEQPYYSDSDIEAICTDELSKLGLLPNQPQPIRIDRFVRKALCHTDL